MRMPLLRMPLKPRVMPLLLLAMQPLPLVTQRVQQPIPLLLLLPKLLLLKHRSSNNC
jgi:hypothetical protein